MKAKDKALLQAQINACAAIRAKHISRAVTQQAAQAAADRVAEQAAFDLAAKQRGMHNAN